MWWSLVFNFCGWIKYYWIFKYLLFPLIIKLYKRRTQSNVCAFVKPKIWTDHEICVEFEIECLMLDFMLGMDKREDNYCSWVIHIFSVNFHKAMNFKSNVIRVGAFCGSKSLATIQHADSHFDVYNDCGFILKLFMLKVQIYP